MLASWPTCLQLARQGANGLLVMIPMQQIVEFSDRIAEHFEPDKIILFGSYAYGSPDDDSDVDLLVIMPFEGRGRKKSVEIWKKLRPTFSVDLMLRTPADIE